MNQQQIDQLLALLSEIAKSISTQREYTLTGAADWPMLVILFGFFGALLMAAGSFAWLDIRSKIDCAFSASTKVAEDSKGELKEYKTEVQREIDGIWHEIERCQSECCPPRVTQRQTT